MTTRHLALLIATAIVCFSCQMMKFAGAVGNEEVEYRASSKWHFEVENSTMKGPIKLNDKTYLGQFDTGASSSVLYEDRISVEGLKAIASNIGNAKTANNSVSLNAYIVDSFDMGIVNVEKAVLSTIDRRRRKSCAPEKQPAGLIGLNYFSDNKKVLSINFTDKSISLIDQFTPDDDWTLIQSVYKNGLFYIDLEGNGEYYLMDSGYSGFLSLSPSSALLTSTSEKKYHGETNVDATGEASVDTATIAWLSSYDWNSTSFENAQVSIARNKDHQLIGLKLIQHFDWVLDFKNKALYARPHKERRIDLKKEETFFLNYGFLPKRELEKNQLIVRLLEIGGKAKKIGLEIGDTLLAIDNIDLSKESVCDSYKKLAYYQPVDKVQFTVLRNGEELVLEE